MNRLPQSRARQTSSVFLRVRYLSIFSLPSPGVSRDRAKDIDLREALKGLQEKKLKILIIDDESAFRASMKILLTKAFKAEVADVESGYDGLANVSGSNSYDIIFLDLMMPGMSGNQTYTELIKLKSSLHVVFMSAYSSSKEWETARNSGVTLLHKPIPLEELVRVLSQCGGVRP